jgi:hypothetical protein
MFFGEWNAIVLEAVRFVNASRNATRQRRDEVTPSSRYWFDHLENEADDEIIGIPGIESIGDSLFRNLFK